MFRKDYNCILILAIAAVLGIVGTIITAVIALSVTIVTEYDKINYKKLFTFYGNYVNI